MRLTKIVCTIGLKTEKKEYLSALVDAGMNVMRLNFSHGDHDEHGARIQTLREILKEKKDKSVAILLDTKGPEIRTRGLRNGDVVLEKGQKFTLTTKDIQGDNSVVSITYENLPNDVKKGDTILLDDGLIRLLVEDVSDTDILCEVQNSGELGEKKGVNVPNVSIKLPALSQKDKGDLIFGCEQKVDYIAASFIRKKSDVEEVRKLLNEHGGYDIKIISKIENQEGLDNFEEILEASDGIMVARGDLGVEVPMYELPLIQKMIVQRAVEESKIVITATQMLESMIKNSRPTRAEVSDIANAVFDGTDAVMLSGETAKHNCAYPVEAVKMMAEVCERVDREIDGKDFDLHSSMQDANIPKHLDFTEAIAKGTVETANKLDAKLIIVASIGGRVVRKIRKHFPKQPILVLSTKQKTVNQMILVRGTQTAYIDSAPDHNDFYTKSIDIAKDRGLVKDGEIVLVVTGGSIGEIGVTDMLKIMKA